MGRKCGYCDSTDTVCRYNYANTIDEFVCPKHWYTDEIIRERREKASKNKANL